MQTASEISAPVPAATHGHGVFLLCATADTWEVGEARLKPASLGGWHYAETMVPSAMAVPSES